MVMIWQLLFLSVLQLSVLTVAANVVVVTILNRTECTFAAYGAAFGPHLDPGTEIRGYMRRAEPADACTPIKRAPKHAEAPLQLPYFALITRSPRNCNFDVKVLHAQQAGFAGAVVHNVRGHDEIFVMHANNDSYMYMYKHVYLERYNITIPSQFIGYEDSQVLTNFIETDYMYSVILNGDIPSFPEPYYYIIPFFVVVCIIVIILVIALIVKVCREYFHSRRARLSKRHLKKLPTKKFVKNSDPFETCAICLDDFEEGDKIRILPCNHAYHCLCIDPWLLKQKRCCPVCKRKIRFGRRRRDPPTAAPDSSDSDGAADTGDERTPLLGSAAASEEASPVAAAGVINSDNAQAAGSRADANASDSRLRRLLAALLSRRLSWRRAYEEEDGAQRGAVGPAGYGSFDPVPPNPVVGSINSSHVVEVHAPREPDAREGSSQTPAEVV